uniref:Putative secreted protein n=1 Tax=Anopheles marajoara TaxID=58244 RepID=A0A2M4CA87_9DIPT
MADRVLLVLGLTTHRGPTLLAEERRENGRRAGRATEHRISTTAGCQSARHCRHGGTLLEMRFQVRPERFKVGQGGITLIAEIGSGWW